MPIVAYPALAIVARVILVASVGRIIVIAAVLRIIVRRPIAASKEADHLVECIEKCSDIPACSVSSEGIKANMWQTSLRIDSLWPYFCVSKTFMHTLSAKVDYRSHSHLLYCDGQLYPASAIDRLRSVSFCFLHQLHFSAFLVPSDKFVLLSRINLCCV